MKPKMYVHHIKKNNYHKNSYNVVFQKVGTVENKLEVQFTAVNSSDELEALCKTLRTSSFLNKYTIDFNSILHWCIDNGFSDINEEYLKLKMI